MHETISLAVNLIVNLILAGLLIASLLIKPNEKNTHNRHGVDGCSDTL